MADWKQQLVDQVKAWQRMSASHKEAWYRFVQERTGGAHFDPNRHDEATLREFIQMGEAGQIDLQAPTGLGSSGGSKGKGGGCWGDAGKGGGVWGDGGKGGGVSGNGGNGFEMTTGKQGLVERVKAWQRMSASHKEAWYRYVQEKTYEGNFDPNRHDEATLREFIQMGEAGQIDLQAPTGLGSSGGSKGKGGGCWGDAGKGGGVWGDGGKGGGVSGNGGNGFEMTTGKQGLVERVKAWQRMSASHKEAWYRYVQEKTYEGNFDPNRHDEATLGQFLQLADAGMIQLLEPTGLGSSGGSKGKGGGWGGKGRGVAFDITAGKEGLVEQVKGWQRISASHKEAWYRFAQERSYEGNFDPNRHDETTLREFIQMADAGQIELMEPTGLGSNTGRKGKGKGGGWGGGDSWGPMHEMVTSLMMSFMGAKGKGGKKGKGWAPY
eukprot:TRINITY_DN1506_c0_g1_i1.p1 TRINITY_DN1506_c0_g1~~TRINITY_DN1506_c0_g1_i1.p1  ORF type:complete len:436 (+),score=83.23 TRINITY_DN1506_c0_g1_i1:78-1385(+)